VSFTDYERQLIEGARKSIDVGHDDDAMFGTQFICIALQDAYRSIHGIRSMRGVIDTTTQDLRHRVVLAIEGHSTFEIYFFTKTGIRPERWREKDEYDRYVTEASEIRYIPRMKFYDLCQMARLAWIDRMLEDGEIK
jgi:hypothetical protein